MDRKTGTVLSIAMAAGLAAGFLADGANAMAALGKCFAALGEGLRRLSLAGSAGNALAWALYAVLGLWPLLGLLPIKRRRGAEDALWVIASIYAFFMLYALVNPFLVTERMLPEWMGRADAAMTALSLVIPLASLLAAAVCLRLTHAGTGRERLLKRVSLLLTVVEAVAVFAVFGGIGGWRNAEETAFDGMWFETRNTAALNGQAVFGTVCGAVGTAFLLAVCEAARALINGLTVGWLEDGNAPLADQLAVRARRMLAAELLIQTVRNAVQFFFGASVTNMNMLASLPLDGLILALSALLLARFVREAIRVRSENDSFI